MASDIVLICAVIAASLTFPVIACIGVAGWYMIERKRQDNAIILEQLEQSELTNRENMRTQRAMAKGGQSAGAGGLDLMQLAQMFAPLLLKQGVTLNTGDLQHGKEIQQGQGLGGPPVR